MSDRPLKIELRAARLEDMRSVWAWRNDPETRRASLDPEPIAWEVHAAWFREALARRDRELYVVVCDGAACGAARLDVAADEAAVSIHLAPEARHRGVGPAALRAVAELAGQTLGVERITARIKPENHASQAAFSRAGFSLRKGRELVTAERACP